MSRVFFREELETVATFWRIMRRDGVTLGFTSHNRDLWFGGVNHRAAPGMIPTAIRLEASLKPDSVEVEGALSHDSISGTDIEAGRFDGARIEIGIVDWESCENAVLYRGEIGEIAQEASGFSAQLLSMKAELDVDLVPRTSPTCRAEFCGPSCNLSSPRFTHETLARITDDGDGWIDLDATPKADVLIGGSLRWVDGPDCGRKVQIVEADGERIRLDEIPHGSSATTIRVLVTEGCDHTFATCAARFANSANFQGEPFLPGNDLLARYAGAGA